MRKLRIGATLAALVLSLCAQSSAATMSTCQYDTARASQAYGIAAGYAAAGMWSAANAFYQLGNEFSGEAAQACGL